MRIQTDGRRTSRYDQNCLAEQVTKFSEVWGYAKYAARSAIFVNFISRSLKRLPRNISGVKKTVAAMKIMPRDVFAVNKPLLCFPPVCFNPYLVQ